MTKLDWSAKAKKEKKLPKSSYKAYGSWKSMKKRCLDPNNIVYKYYGERGIKICKSWLNFYSFLNDMGERPDGTSLDRIDVNGNYEPKNCRWASRSTQNYNSRKRKSRSIYRGVTKNISGWRCTLFHMGEKYTTNFETEEEAAFNYQLHMIRFEKLTLSNLERQANEK